MNPTVCLDRQSSEISPPVLEGTSEPPLLENYIIIAIAVLKRTSYDTMALYDMHSS